MKMIPTQGVSFPRSGHAPIYHIARCYFGNALVYCDTNNTRFCGCESVPCINPNRTFAKNHDFGLRKSPGVPIIPTEHYFIQYRNPVRSITSHFKVYLNKHPDENHRSGWERFAFRDAYYWNRFIDKWVLDFPLDAVPPLYCTYEALIAAPESRVKEILTFLSDGPLDEDRACLVMEQNPISLRNNLAAFEFYDPIFLRELESVTSDRLVELDLPSIEEDL